jgi:hypothetical protein
MPAPIVSQAELQRVHSALRITVPLDQASPLVLTTLAVVAHCWRTKGSTKNITHPERATRHQPLRTADDTQQAIDLKRRAAGDFD